MWDRSDDEIEFEQLAWSAIKGNDLGERASALLSLARVKLNDENEPAQAIPLALAAADLFNKRKDRLEQFHSLRLVAECQNTLHKYAECLSSLNHSLLIAEDLLDPDHLASTKFNIAGTLIALKRPAEAINHALSAAAIWSSEINHVQTARSHVQAARGLVLEKRLSEALEQMRSALSEYKVVEEHFRVADCYARITDILIDLGRIDEASDTNDKANAIIDLLDIGFLKQQSLFNRARIYAAKGLHQLALPLYNEGLVFFRAMPEPANVCKITYERAKSLSATGNREQALQDLKNLALFIDEMPVQDLEVEQVYGQIWQLVDIIDVPLDGLEIPG